MDELVEILHLENLEQLRVLADPLRMRILEQLVRRPMTMSQLGEVFGETTAKMHYHVRELEKHGFIRLVEKRERGGFIEKYYRAVAKDVKVPEDLLRTTPSSEIARTVQDYFEGISREVLRTMTAQGEQADPPGCMAITDETLWLTPQEFEEVSRQLQALLDPFRQRRNLPGERNWLAHFIAHTFTPGDTIPSNQLSPLPFKAPGPSDNH